MVRPVTESERQTLDDVIVQALAIPIGESVRLETHVCGPDGRDRIDGCRTGSWVRNAGYKAGLRFTFIHDTVQRPSRRVYLVGAGLTVTSIGVYKPGRGRHPRRRRSLFQRLRGRLRM